MICEFLDFNTLKQFNMSFEDTKKTVLKMKRFLNNLYKILAYKSNLMPCAKGNSSE